MSDCAAARRLMGCSMSVRITSATSWVVRPSGNSASTSSGRSSGTARREPAGSRLATTTSYASMGWNPPASSTLSPARKIRDGAV